ncbi:hypothetical protein [Amycolatopsis sp. FDAARGOS 1241]|uniref:hypothetical protein n=1 Tax=Amycolatopsis sp. FDAARGOS 1241 TaxID=2778070 RepID=UPI001951950A|nr:hypothetical protein [Amycolatopsis sp. FDAARGOS 1241]QRP46582.1 hypothetical protein I6J71_00365 [Amycolatopsis sp. FDAARGOS 1241]
MNEIGKTAIWFAAAAAALATVAACGPDGPDHAKNVSYVTGAQGKADADARLPGWVPDDATAVTEAIRTTGSERILRYTPGASGLPATCAPGPAPAKPATLSAGWWPARQEKRTDRVCDGDWHVVEDHGDMYAYKPETVSHR